MCISNNKKAVDPKWFDNYNVCKKSSLCKIVKQNSTFFEYFMELPNKNAYK